MINCGILVWTLVDICTPRLVVFADPTDKCGTANVTLSDSKFWIFKWNSANRLKANLVLLMESNWPASSRRTSKTTLDWTLIDHTHTPLHWLGCSTYRHSPRLVNEHPSLRCCRARTCGTQNGLPAQTIELRWAMSETTGKVVHVVQWFHLTRT